MTKHEAAKALADRVNSEDGIFDTLDTAIRYWAEQMGQDPNDFEFVIDVAVIEEEES